MGDLSNIHCKDCGAMLGHVHRPGCPKLGPMGNLPPLPEPESFLFQHEETGQTMFVDAQQVEWGFEKNNPRLHKVSEAFNAAQLIAFAEEAVKQEREACLRICESTKHLGYVPAEDGGARDYYDAAAEDCAAAIRARSEQGGG